MIPVAHLALALAIGWAASELALRRIFKGELPAAIGGPERSLLAIAGVIAFAVAAMIGHIVTGGAVFGVAVVVPALGAGILLQAIPGVRWPRLPWKPLIAMAAILIALYVLPVVLGGSGVRTGDSPWHLGWTHQLLAGEPVPTGPAPEFGRNAYPWGLHAYLATLVRLVPGSDPLSALQSLHLLLVAALPLSAACIGRLLDRRAGWAAAGAAALVGGFGWIAARGADFVLSPTDARYGADLVVASPNSVYEMLPPGLPRELGLALLAAAAVGLAIATSDRRARIPAGIALGLVGLVSVPMFVNGIAWFMAVMFFAPRTDRKDIALRVGLPGFATFLLWAGPVASNAIRFGGFVDITPKLGEEWPLYVALAAWGLLLPAAVAGVVLARRKRSLVYALAIATTTLLVLSLARSAFDWTLAGNATLLHQGRVWPVAHLLAAGFAGVALIRVFGWLRVRSRDLTVFAATAMLVVAAVSPTLASIEMTKVLRENSGGFEYDSPDLAEDGFVRKAAALLSPDDVLAVRGPNELGWLLWQFSGARLAAYDDPRLQGNELRIRYAELAEAYEKRLAAGGFTPDLVVVPLGESQDEPLVVGTFAGATWSLERPPTVALLRKGVIM